jgi:hypothetical protein
MCIIAAKYFTDIGWVLAKNRDQDYISQISFRDETDPDVGEILVMYDHNIKYQEGMNHDGLVIITTSLTPSLQAETNKKDGDHIYAALRMKQDAAVKYIVKQKMTGFIFVATPKRLILIEAGRKDDGKGEYHSTVTEIPTSKTIVRTNHGIDLPWAGFQYGFTDTQDMWRKSSETRKELAELAMVKAKTPVEMLDALASRRHKDLQFNLFRVENKPRQMRTIFQWALVPSEDVAIIRPIQTKLDLKVTRQKLRVEVIDNEIIKKIYDGRIKHFAKIETIQNGEIKTVIK